MAPAGYWQRLTDKRISRRRALKTGAGAVAGLGIAGLGFAACGGREEEVAGGNTPPASTPQAGGKATIGTTSDVPTFDPTTSPAAPYIGGRLYNPLHTYNFETQEIVPLIAQSIEQPDEMTYVWKLNPGVKFQNVDPVNGREVVAEDARYTFDRLANTSTMNDQALVKRHTASLQAPDKYTFVLKTNKLYSLTLTNSALMQYCIVPKEAVDKFGDLAKNAVGSGPFSMAEHVRGERVVFRKNPDYFRTGRPFVDEEEWLVIQDPSTQWEALKTKRIDTCSLMVQGPQREELQNYDFIELLEARDTSGPLFYMRVDRPPLDDERVREALDIAVDRDDYLAKVHFGEGKWNGPVPWTLDYWSLPQEELQTALKCDPEKAKQLLSAAGYVNGFELKPPIRTDIDAATPMIVIAEHYKKVGVKVSVVPTELGRWLAAVYGGDYDITLSGTFPYLEPEVFLRYYTSGGTTGTNSTHINDPEMDAWVEGIWSIFDREQQRDYILDVQRKILKKHGPMICLCQGDYQLARNKRLQGYGTSRSGPLYWMGTEYWIDKS